LSLSGPDYTESSVNTVKHFVKESSADPPSPEQFYKAFERKFGVGPSYQVASAMAGLYHLGTFRCSSNAIIDSSCSILNAARNM